MPPQSTTEHRCRIWAFRVDRWVDVIVFHLQTVWPGSIVLPLSSVDCLSVFSIKESANSGTTRWTTWNSNPRSSKPSWCLHPRHSRTTAIRLSEVTHGGHVLRQSDSLTSLSTSLPSFCGIHGLLLPDPSVGMVSYILSVWSPLFCSTSYNTAWIVWNTVVIQIVGLKSRCQIHCLVQILLYK